MAKRVLVVFETSWDRPQLEACRARWSGRYAVDFASPSDAECAWDLDVIGYIADEAARRRGALDGVFSSSDYPGATVAAGIAAELALPGSAPVAVLRASHKYASRLAQREAVPEAVPGFARIDPDDPRTFAPPIGFPCFVKPVKGAFSMMSGAMASRDELASFVTSERAAWFRDEFLNLFHHLAEHYRLGHDGRGFVAEELLSGHQVTVECWIAGAAGGVLGTVDSVFRPGTRSFSRFDYPSSLPDEVQARLGEHALRAARHLGLESTLFNVELVWNPDTDAIGIVEVNPRLCGQFGDLYQRVEGVNGYELALALAVGDEPPLARGGGEFGAASSFPLRVFEKRRVLAAPSPERVREIEARHPGVLVWTECGVGDVLDPGGEMEDGASCRYTVLNVGGADRADAVARAEVVRAELGFEMERV